MFSKMFHCSKALFPGLGAGVAWWVTWRLRSSITFSDIGSAELDLSNSITNNNSPDISQSAIVRNTASNTNNDQDTINQVNTVTVSNINSGKRRRRKRRVIDDLP